MILFMYVIPTVCCDGWLWLVSGQLSTSKPQFTVQEEIRANIAMNNYYERDENLQVNGKVFIIDVSGMNLNHLSRMNNSDLKHLQKKLQV